MSNGTHQGRDALWMVQMGGGQTDMDVDSIHAGLGGGGACRPEMALDDCHDSDIPPSPVHP